MHPRNLASLKGFIENYFSLSLRKFDQNRGISPHPCFFCVFFSLFFPKKRPTTALRMLKRIYCHKSSTMQIFSNFQRMFPTNTTLFSTLATHNKRWFSGGLLVNTFHYNKVRLYYITIKYDYITLQ